MRHFKDNVLRVVAVLGLIAVLLLGAWGIIQLAFWLPSLLGDVTGTIGGIFKREPAKETVTLSLPAQTTSGSAFTVTFLSRNAAGERTYGFAYQCREGVSFAIALPGKNTEKVVCNTPFILEGATTSVRVTPTLTGKEAVQVGISIAATDRAGTVAATSTGGTTVSPTKATESKPAAKPTTTASPSSTYYPSGRTANLYGYADLMVAINSAYASGGRGTVQFTVTNIGTNIASQNWFFIANLPIRGGYTYTSPAQQALYPGDRIVFTMGYDNFGGSQYCPPSSWGEYAPCSVGGYDYRYDRRSAESVTIHVDPYNIVPEINEYNNTSSASYYGY
ncbi:MAG: hypothetical protein AAB964_02655 [Patescibacteria group bacterium]